MKKYLEGKKVLALDLNSTNESGGYDVFDFEHVFDHLNFLVNVPAVPDPDFEQAVGEMIESRSAETDPNEREEDDSGSGTLPPRGRPEVDKPPARKKRRRVKAYDPEVLKSYVKSGKTNEEIAELLGVNANTVKGWIRKEDLIGLRSRGGRRKKGEPEETDEQTEPYQNAERISQNVEYIGRNADRHLCKTCKYRCTDKSMLNAGIRCEYWNKAGRTRSALGIKADDCSVYEKGAPVKRRAFQEEIGINVLGKMDRDKQEESD